MVLNDDSAKEQELNVANYRVLHLKIKAGETVVDSSGVRYTNKNPHVAVRITVLFPRDSGNAKKE
jgi:hypothetical protein